MATITPNTPVRLENEVCAAFAEAYAEMIEEHGASYAVNFVIASHLRKRGHSINPLETPSEKIAAAQSRRWENVREANETKARKRKSAARTKEKKQTAGTVLAEAQDKLERQRELKRKRDERYRAKKKEKKERSAEIKKAYQPADEQEE